MIGRARAAVLIALAIGACGCQAAIESGLPEAQANRVLVALDQHGIHGVKEAERSSGDRATYSVVVAPDDVAAALAVLRAEDLPSEPEPGLQEMFGEGSLVPTATEERARLTAALGGELARSIEAIDGVLDARVHLALADRSDVLLDDAPERPRASVLIRHRGATAPYSDEQIRRLVAGAIQGMDPSDVAIVAVAASEIATSTPHLTSIGPIAVSRGSATTLKLILGSMLAMNVLLAMGLVLALVRRQRAIGPGTRAGSDTTDSSATGGTRP